MAKSRPARSDLSSQQTSPTLLGRLRANPRDPLAWQEFVRRYGPKIYDWCRRWKMQDADAQDVVQTVLVKFSRSLPTFEYDHTRSFRALLKTLTRYAWLDACERQRRAIPQQGGADAREQLLQVQAREDLARQLDEEFDRELLEQAMIRVARRVHTKTWEAFRLTALEGISGQEAAARLGMKVTALYVAKSSVLKMLQQEVQALNGEST